MLTELDVHHMFSGVKRAAAENRQPNVQETTAALSDALAIVASVVGSLTAIAERSK